MGPCTICAWTIILILLCAAVIAASTAVGLPIAGGLLIAAIVLYFIWVFLLIWIDLCCIIIADKANGGKRGRGSGLGLGSFGSSFSGFSSSCGCSG